MVYDILPTTNLKYDDIRDSLNAAGGMVNNDISSAFKTTANINKWSKYKPVAYPQLFTDDYPNWYRDTNGNCGINPDTYITTGNAEDLIPLYKAGAWQYIPPKGGVTEPYRLSDFRDYYRNALPFFQSPFSKGELINLNVEENTKILIKGQYTEPTGSLNLSDFWDLGEGGVDAYLGVMVYHGNPLDGATLQNTYVSDKTIQENGSVTLTFTADDVARKVHLALFMSTPNYNMCIPYTDDNYWLVEVGVQQDFLLDVKVPLFGVLGSSDGFSPTHWEEFALDSDNGNADIRVAVFIINNYSENITIGTTDAFDFNIRGMVEAWTYDAILCDASGGTVPSVTINGNSSKQFYVRFNDLFKNFVGTMTGDQLTTTFRLQMKSNRLGGLDGYQTLAGPYPILVQK